MQAEATLRRKRLQQMRDHVAAQAADLGAAERQVDARPATPAEVDRDLGERLVEGNDGVAETADAPPLTERPMERLAEGNADVLGGVVLIDVQVAFGAHGQIEASVTSQAVQHVIEEADARGDIAATRA